MTKKPKIKVMLVDDHFVVRMGLSSSINIEPDMEVVAEAATGEQALEVFSRQPVDIVLLDLRLADMDGIETARRLGTGFPGTKIIMLSTYEGDEDIFRAIEAGARAYLLKTVQRDELLKAIRVVHAGERYLTATVGAVLAARLQQEKLTPRELEVLQAIARGRSNKEAAADLAITEVTVKLHVSGILRKLGANDRTQAVTIALQRGILHLHGIAGRAELPH